MRCRTKVLGYEAFRLGIDYIPDWFMDKVTTNEIILHGSSSGFNHVNDTNADITTDQGQGVVHADFGDYIIWYKRIDKIHVCKPDIFNRIYEEVVDESSCKKYPVITLCGSTKFKEEFIEVQKKLTLEGNIVISVGLFGHSGDDEVWSDNTKEMLDDMHKRKIDMSDEIFVINVGGYIGRSTQSEIEYAKSKGLVIRYLENI